MKKFGLFILSGFAFEMVFSQNTIDSSVDIAGITIQENRMGIPFSKNGRNIDIIDRKTIQTLPVQSVAEILSYVTGIEIRQRGILGTQADIGTLGGSFDQTLILIDGVRFNDPQTGHHNLNLPISVSQIERIEILKGSAARIYGINALAGAINIVTRNTQAAYSEMQLNGGSDFRQNPEGLLSKAEDHYQYGIQGLHSQGNALAQHSLSLNYQTSNGQNYNNGFETYKGMYLGKYKVSNGQMQIQLSYIDNQFGNNGFYAAPIDKDAWERVRTAFTHWGYQFNLGQWKLQSRIHFRRNEDDYLLRKYQPSFYKNNHITRQYGIEQHAMVKNALGAMGLGLEYLSNNITSNRLGANERRNFGAYFEQQYENKSQRLGISAGVYFNYNTDYSYQWLPGADVFYKINTQFTLFANASAGTRQPTYTDLYYVSPTNVNNPFLQPENAMCYELGMKVLSINAKGIRIWGQISGFYRNVNELIDWFKADSIRWKPENIHKQQSMGMDARIGFRPLSSSLSSTKKWGWNQLLLGLTYNQMELVTDRINEARYSINNLKWQASASFQWYFLRNIKHTVTYRLRERLSDVDPLHLIDTRLSFTNKQWECYLNVQNLTGVNYTEIAPIQMPRNWCTIGIIKSFKSTN